MSLIFQKPPNNYQYQVGVENVVDYSDSVISGGPTLIAPSNTLARNGQRLNFYADGSINGVAAAKSFDLIVNGGAPISLATFLAADTGTWIARLEISRRFSLNTLLVSHIIMGTNISGVATQRVALTSIAGLDFTASLSLALQITVGGGDTRTTQFAILSVL